MAFGNMPKKVGKLPIVPDMTLPGPNLTGANPLKMAQNDSFCFHFLDLDL